MLKKSTYDFFVETDSYAGNFERELCAYVFGAIGDCEVGEELVDSEIEDLFDPYINRHYSNDDGCYRPVEITEYQGEWNSLVVGLYKPIEDFELLEIIETRLKEFAKMEKIKIKQFKIRAVHIMTTYDELYTYLSNIK